MHQHQSMQFQLLVLNEKAHRLANVLNEAISFFENHAYQKAQIHLIQKLQKIDYCEKQLIHLFPFFAQKMKQISNLLLWMVCQGANNFAYSKKILKIVLIQIILNQKDLNLPKLYSKYFNTKQFKNIIPNETSKFQAFWQQLKQKMCPQQLKIFFTQVGGHLTKIGSHLDLRCYALYYQIDLTNDSKFLLGNALVNANDLENGLNYLGQIDYERYDLAGLELMQNVYYKLGRIGECLTASLRIIELDNECLQYTARSLFKIGSICQDFLFHSQSIKRYMQSLNFNKRRNEQEQKMYFQCMYRIGLIYYFNEDYETAIRILQRILDEDKIPIQFQIKVYKEVARTLAFVKNYQKSLYYYHKLEQIEDSSDVLERIGVNYIYLEDYDKASEYFNQLLLKNDRKGGALTYLSYISLKQGNSQLAQQQLDLAEKQNKYQVITNLAYSHIIEGIFGKNDASKGKLESANAQIAAHFYHMGLKFRQYLKFNNSLFYLRKSLSYNPQNANIVKYQIAVIVNICQRWNECIQILNSLLEVEPNNYVILITLYDAYNSTQNKQKKVILARLEELNYHLTCQLSKASQIRFLSKISNAQFVDGININLLPNGKDSAQHSAFLKKLDKVIAQYQIFKQHDTIEKIYNIFKSVFNDTNKLFHCACSFAKKNFLEIATIFCKRYFTIKPFDKQALLKYIKLIDIKSTVTKNDLKNIENLMRRENKNAQIYFELSKLSMAVKDKYNALNYGIEAFKLSPNQQNSSFLEKQFHSLKYSEEEYLLRMVKIRGDYFRIHERLARIFRRQDNNQKQVYHLEQVMKYSWNHQKCLMRLRDIFRKSSPERYFLCVKELSAIQMTNSYLLMDLAELYGSSKNIKCQIDTYNQILRICPENEEIYSKLEDYFRNNIDQKGEINCYRLLQNVLDESNRSKLLLLSCWFRHYGKLAESFSCFLFAIQEIYSNSRPNEINKKMKVARQWLERSAKRPLDIDFRLKNIILTKLIGEEPISDQLKEILFLANSSRKITLGSSALPKLVQLCQTYLHYCNPQTTFILQLIQSQFNNDDKNEEEVWEYSCNRHSEISLSSHSISC